jgi:deoxycytidylate deaminase
MNHKEIMSIAWENSVLSPCLKKQVGAVLYTYSNYTEQLFEGYGGWIEPCGTCVRKDYEWQQDGCRSIHAEMRAIFMYIEAKGLNGTEDDFESCVMYTTHGPCDQCLKYMAYFGIKQVIYDLPYHNDYSKWAGIIEVCRLNEDGTTTKQN